MSNTTEEVTPKPTRKRVAKKAVPHPAIENVEIVDATVKNDDDQEVIVGPTKGKSPRTSNSFMNDENVLSSKAADSALKRKVNTEKPKDDSEKIALWSNKNIRWTGVGTLTKGYNIVTKEAADQWLAKEGIREATPEEVASYYGK